MEPETSTKDRREFQRYTADLRLQVRREGTPAPGLRAGVFEARCVDLSRGGARFVSRELFHRREKLVLVFFRPDGQPELACEIEVVRTVRVSRQYETAARLVRHLDLNEINLTDLTADGWDHFRQ